MASSAAPAGELSLCFAHVSAPKAGDVERKAVNELVVRRTERFECEQVYEGSDHARCFADMFGLELEPGADRPEVLRAAVEDAMSVAVLFLGAYDQSKPALFHGRGGAADAADDCGCVGWFGENLLQLLHEKRTGMSAGGASHEWELRVSCVELFDECLSDLLAPENTELRARLDPARGHVVVGAERRVLRSPADVREVVRRARANRTTLTLPMGGAAESSCALFEFELEQREADDAAGAGAHAPRVAESRVLLVDLPSTHHLVTPAAELVVQHGPTLNKALFAFGDVVRALSSPSTAQAAPFARSTLTTLLQDVLGGDAIVVGLACVASGQPGVSSATMQLLRELARASHFPTSKNKTYAHGLLLKYRTALDRALDRASDADRPARAGGDAEGTGALLEERLRSLEHQLTSAQLDCNTAKEDGVKVYKVLELFKAKYTQLVDEKATQAKELIEAEEAKLSVARALLDIKMEHGQQTEKFEGEKYELKSELLTAKNEICELEIKLQDAVKLSGDSSARAEQAARESDEMRADAQALRSKMAAASESLAAAEATKVDVQSELLTLVAKCEKLSSENGALQAAAQRDAASASGAQKSLSGLREREAQLEAELQRERVTHEDTRAAKIKAELELERAHVGFEQKRLDHDRSTAEFLREKDGEIIEARRASEQELQRLRAEKEQMTETLKALGSEKRHEERRARDLETELQRKKADAAEAASAADAARAQLEELRTKFRERLVEQLVPEDAAGDDAGDAGGGAAAARDGASASAASSSIIESYAQRERALTSELEATSAAQRELLRKNRLLYDTCARLRDELEDTSGKPAPIPSEAELTVPKSDEEFAAEAEASQLQARLHETQTELSLQQQKALQVADTFQQMIKSLEARTHALTEEKARLAADGARLTEELRLYKDKASIEKLESSQAGLAQQLSSLESTLATSNGDLAHQYGAGGGGDDASALRARMAQQQRELSLKTDECLQLKQQLSDARAEAQQLRRRLKSEGAGGGADPAQLAEAEKRNYALMSRNAALEEELRQYREYMKATVARYQQALKGKDISL